MTPNDLLRAVKIRFTTLLLDEHERLEELLKHSMRRYQDKAGATGSLYIDAASAAENGVEVPPFFMQLIGCHDNNGSYHETRIDYDGFINVANASPWSQPPYKVDFVMNLSMIPLDIGQLPPESVGLIEQHLYHLIELQNNERLKLTNQAARLPADHIPAQAETQAKIDQIELAMDEEGSFLPSAYIAGGF